PTSQIRRDYASSKAATTRSRRAARSPTPGTPPTSTASPTTATAASAAPGHPEPSSAEARARYEQAAVFVDLSRHPSTRTRKDERSCRSGGASFVVKVNGRREGPVAVLRGRPPTKRNRTMRVMVIVKATKNSEAGVLPDEKLLRDMGAFNEELVKAGIMLDGDGLQPSSKGKRIHFANGKKTTIDGPFAETKELIAGFWIWQVKSMEEAVEWARRCPDPMPGEE